MPQIIGTRHETNLHRQLKLGYAGRDGRTEVEIAGFVVDVVNADGKCIEVQTCNFGQIRKKAKGLAELYGLKIVYPVTIAKYLEVFDAKGKRQSQRKSPRSGSIWDVFGVLIYAPELPLLPGLEIELALVDVAEERVSDGKGSWRRKGLSIRDRRLLALREQICLSKPADYLRFVPFARNEEFTTGTLGERVGIRVELAKKTLYVLTKIGIVERIGKQGNAYVYRLLATSRTKKWKKKL
ncbi:MAG: hypothetical protein FWB78_00125 [Treponema sp.]|nr:hypothetical protein [Treponema sp.]